MEFESIWRMVLSFVSNSGIWAFLFVLLLIVLITTNGQREEKYQNLIQTLSASLKKVDEIKEDVEDIKYKLGIGGNYKLKFEEEVKEIEEKTENQQNSTIKDKGDNNDT